MADRRAGGRVAVRTAGALGLLFPPNNRVKKLIANNLHQKGVGGGDLQSQGRSPESSKKTALASFNLHHFLTLTFDTRQVRDWRACRGRVKTYPL